MCFCWLFDQQVTFLVRILVRKCKKRKKVKKPLRFIWKIVKRAILLYFPIVFCKKAPATTGSYDFLDFSILRYVEAFPEGLLMVGVYFLLFSLIFFRSIVVYLKLGPRLNLFCHFPSISSEVSLCYLCTEHWVLG